MPRRRANRRTSQKKFTLKALLVGLALVIMVSLVFLVFNRLTGSSQNDSAASQTTTSQVTTESVTQETTEESSQVASSLDVTSLATGDYSSAQGIWQNSLGDTVTLDGTGLQSASIQGMTDFTLTPYQLLADGIYQATLTSVDGAATYSMTFIQAGTVLPESYFMAGYSDTSDGSRDRIYITNQTFGSDNFASAMLYKVAELPLASDSTETTTTAP